MTSILRPKLRRRHIGVALVWLILVLTNQAAEASCGDWLHTGTGMANLGRTDAADSLVPMAPASEAPNSPCEGPSCGSRQPVRMPPAPQSKTTTERDEGTLIRSICHVAPAAPGAYPGDEEVAAQQGFPLAIEHPPRR